MGSIKTSVIESDGIGDASRLTVEVVKTEPVSGGVKVTWEGTNKQIGGYGVFYPTTFKLYANGKEVDSAKGKYGSFSSRTITVKAKTSPIVLKVEVIGYSGQTSSKSGNVSFQTQAASQGSSGSTQKKSDGSSGSSGSNIDLSGLTNAIDTGASIDRKLIMLGGVGAIGAIALISGRGKKK